jgi:hypothetical protein
MKKKPTKSKSVTIRLTEEHVEKLNLISSIFASQGVEVSVSKLIRLSLEGVDFETFTTLLLQKGELLEAIHEDVRSGVYKDTFKAVDDKLPVAVWNGSQWDIMFATREQRDWIKYWIIHYDISGSNNGIAAMARKSNEKQSESDAVSAYANGSYNAIYFAVFGKNSGFKNYSFTKTLKDMFERRSTLEKLYVANMDRTGAATTTRNAQELVWAYNFVRARDIETDIDGSDLRSRNGFIILMISVLLQAEDQFLSNANTKWSRKHVDWLLMLRGEWCTVRDGCKHVPRTKKPYEYKPRGRIRMCHCVYGHFGKGLTCSCTKPFELIESDMELMAEIGKHGNHTKTIDFLEMRKRQHFEREELKRKLQKMLDAMTPKEREKYLLEQEELKKKNKKDKDAKSKSPPKVDPLKKKVLFG